ncbi:MAG: hypothetical protein HYV99_06110 [Betaproteobacteria bacterium]|nr:hypothetical protein [Betaproteobacteria bacterium]MBI2509536.1 hypothetical protein [Betaproteobacteria bacterium]
MKILLVIAAAAGALLLPALADARDWRPGFGAGLQAQERQMKKGPPGQFQRGREFRKNERDERHQGRLTEEERRELHRDLDRANREIYRPQPKR